MLNWLYGLFGSRRFINCKERTPYVYNGGGVPVEQLMTDKRQDVWYPQPQFAMRQAGQIQALQTIGRPLSGVDPLSMWQRGVFDAPPLIYHVYSTQDGADTMGRPLSVGQIVRAMAADAMLDRDSRDYQNG